MTVFDDRDIPDNDSEAPRAPGNQTDRVNGEYHYKNGYTQKIYSDAHYVREEDSTVPPKYYVPPEKPVKEPKEPKPKKEGGKFVRLLCLCLVCALLGGFTGAAIVGRRMTDRMDELERSLGDIQEQDDAMIIGGGALPVETAAEGGLPASQIYDAACKQVVGISTEVTYTNFFGMSSSSAVTGSGFIVSEDGYIITNYHVIEYAYNDSLDVTVMTHDGTRYTASIVGVEADNDIAVLKIDADGLSPVTFGNSDEISVGNTVYAVGNPLGELEFSMTTGHVSALDRLISTEENTDSINMFQIDAAVNSGNSGGPVYNSLGQVIGIVTAKYSSTGVEGIGFAIPINDAAHIANDLINNGYVTGKAYMGVSLNTEYNSVYSQYYKLPMGALISFVEPDGAAGKAGLQSGDVITKLGDSEVTSADELKRAIKNYSAGDTADVEFFRAGESQTIAITFGEAKPAEETQPG